MNNKITFFIGILGVSLFVVSSILGGILENECKEILQSFFKLRRKEKAEKNY